MDKEKLIDILREEQYPEFMIENTIAKIENLSPQIKDKFHAWMQYGCIPALVVEGYSFSQLVSERRMKPIGAFLALDWLMRDPEKALASLQRGIK